LLLISRPIVASLDIATPAVHAIPSARKLQSESSPQNPLEEGNWQWNNGPRASKEPEVAAFTKAVLDVFL
jgi:hypothetical protein